MKMKVKLNLLCGTLLLAAGTYLSGCTDKGTTPGVPQVSKGEPIQFSVGTATGAESRTEYVDSFLLDWNAGDQIRIRCAQAGPTSADYQIATVTSDQWGSLSPVSSSDTMKWGDTDYHTFYAAYPVGRIMDKTSVSNGEFSMKYITNQLDTVVSLSNGAYLTNPDMNNAYMVADTTVNMSTAEHHVRLDFNPIMTTFDITVRAGRYEVATGIINPVTVTGVSVIMPRKINSDVFTYNANEGTIKEEPSENTQSVYVGVRNGTSRYVDLHEGETLNLMAFLPPVDMNVDEDNNKVRIMVHTTGMDYVMSVDGDRIEKQYKYFIQLPDMSPDDSGYNDWISELDSNTPFNQLSIPAYVCTGDESATEITSLLKQGVRAISLDAFFALAGEHPKGGHQLPQSIENVLTDFLNHSTDFLIIWFNDASDNVIREPGRCNNYFNEKFSGKWTSLNSNSITSEISSLFEKQLIVIKKNTYLDYEFFIPEDARPIEGYNKEIYLFPYTTLENAESLNMSENGWGAQFVTDNSINKKLYDYISTYDEQTGCTGIVTIPNAKDTYVNGQYTYSDLLIQSIIDCNFKFRH